MQVVQVVESTQIRQFSPQAAQYLTPIGETVKYVFWGQEQEPSLLGVERLTHEVQFVAEEQIEQPVLQVTQVLFESG